MKNILLLLSVSILVSCNFNSRLYDPIAKVKTSNQNAGNPASNPVPIITDLEITDFFIQGADNGVATLVINTNQAASGVITYTVDGETEIIPVDIDDSLEASVQTIQLPPGAYDISLDLKNENGVATDELTINIEDEPTITPLKITAFDPIPGKITDSSAIIKVRANQASEGFIYYTQNGTEEKVPVSLTNENNNIQLVKLENLEAGKVYDLRVELENVNGVAKDDSVVKIKDADTPVPTLKIEKFKTVPGKTTDSSTMIKVKANQASEGYIYYTQNGVEKKVPVSLKDETSNTQIVTIDNLNAGKVYNLRLVLDSENGTAKANTKVKLKDAPHTPTLKITELRVKQIQGDKVTIISTANEPSTGNLCVGKQCKKVVYNNANGLSQEIVFDVAEGDTAARLGIKSKKDSDKAAIIISLKDSEPKAVILKGGMLLPQDYFNCPGFNSKTMKISKLNAGGDDKFTGSKSTSEFNAHAEFISSTIKFMKKKFGYEYVQGQFDKQVAKNEMITFSQFDLTSFNNIQCVVAKVKGKQIDQWWNTDTIALYASEAGENDFNKVKLAPSMHYSTKTLSDYDWMDSTEKVFIKFLSMNKKRTMKALNKTKHLKFVYEDDSILDYLELYVVHAK